MFLRLPKSGASNLLESSHCVVPSRYKCYDESTVQKSERVLVWKHAKNMKSTSKKSSDKKSHGKKSSGKKRRKTSGSSSSKKTETSTFTSSLPSAVLCCRDDDAVLNTVVNRVVRDVIFPKKQFVLHDKELEANGKVATRCLKELKMEESQWHLVKNLVRIRLNRKRNNAQLGVRRSLFRK